MAGGWVPRGTEHARGGLNRELRPLLLPPFLLLLLLHHDALFPFTLPRVPWRFGCLFLGQICPCKIIFPYPWDLWDSCAPYLIMLQQDKWRGRPGL